LNQVDKSRKIDTKNRTVSLRRNTASIYYSFTKDINDWSEELNISPSRLEEFIFGMSLKENKTAQNPRLQLWKIIANYYDK
jgi:hypothetical protein